MKKKFFKSLSLIILSLAIFAVSFAGCGSGQNEQNPSATTPEGTTADQPKKSTELVVASVNNGPMVTMNELSSEFTKETGIKVTYVMLTENDIRSKIQQDVAVGSGQFDLVTLGTNDIGTYLDNGWTTELQPLFDKMSDADKTAYDFDDLIKANIPAYSSATKGLAAIPLYGESTMIMYRKDLFDAAGLTMPEEPTWEEVYQLAKKLHDPSKNIVGMALRGKPGYGENMYTFGAILYGYGAQWFDMNWQPQLQTPEMKAAWEFYKKLETECGAKDVTSNGYTETLNLMASGNAAIYYDATVSAATFEADNSPIKGKMGYALSPSGPGKGNTQTIGGWGLAITSSSKNQDAAFKYLTWVTGKDYVKLVAEKKGWINVPSGARTSTYKDAEYQKVASFADITLKSLSGASFDKQAVKQTPYTGNTLPNIPEYASIGEQVGQLLADYVSGGKSIDNALAESQKVALQAMKDGGYIK
ncbi:sorbitol-binding protein /mannitol-binding protein [Anaerobacterium chartisolvens]|uniref:Sorbitol-binding protein /mannitol-binding protein n=1 Tax=Anaerobacterium chartisolvens TaxID=1297424 RepID=A0A369B6D2_9FIRM|nr:sugar ABC transporter substrate-binding protein [Anaerobacterium chartisolvens]RCX16106.1 sorbitol-binding protein /mannitol-binding protein [Anaerobacterium chartisolvens]